jgi:OOP family OmpA-OmpF porin
MSYRLCLIAAVAGLSVAQARAADNPAGYVISAGNGAPVTAVYGGCVRTLEWTPGSSYRQCDPQPAAAVGPAPVQPAPAQDIAPAPVLVEAVVVETVVLVAPRAVPFRLSMDALFDFDSAVLRADAGSGLDGLAKQLAQAEYQTMDIVGHADRIGAAKHNQQLSERRANAVREYLAAHGVDGSKVSASGVGSTEPVTGSQCKGLRGKSLISCLQPDRFAEVTVTGTQTSAMR